MPKKAKKVGAIGQPVEEQKEYIKVRATARGEYALQIRNPGEVFLVDTSTLKRMADVAESEIDDTNPITVNGVDYDLASWWEVVDSNEKVDPATEVAKGHTTTHSSANVI